MLLDTGPDAAKPWYAAAAIDTVSSSLQDKHIARIVDRWWIENHDHRNWLMAHAPHVCARMPSAQIDDMLGALVASGRKTREVAGYALAHCRHVLRQEHRSTILSHLNREPLSAEVITLLPTIVERWDSELASRVLDGLWNGDREVRIATMHIMPLLEHYCEERHIARLCRIERLANDAIHGLPYDPRPGDQSLFEERAEAIRTMVSLAHWLSDRVIHHVADIISSRDAAGSVYYTPPPWRLAARISIAQMSTIVDHIHGDKADFTTASWCDLLPPDRIPGQLIVKLARLLQSGGPAVASRVRQLLWRISDIGRLQAIRWTQVDNGWTGEVCAT